MNRQQIITIQIAKEKSDGQCTICVSVVCDYVDRDCDHERCGWLDADTERINLGTGIYCWEDA